MKLYNTLSRQLEDLEPINPLKVTIYHCGPTVYWTQHIGNMRAVYFGDIVRRTLKYLGYEPFYVRNYTDVGHLAGDNAGDADSGEDRMEKGAKREGITVWDVANKYIKIFDEDIKKLNTLPADVAPRATDNIKEQIQMVKTLLDKGFAYITEEAVYFDTTKIPEEEYTKLSHQKLEENIKGAGHGDTESLQKQHPHDFALWFFRHGHYKDHTMHWDTKDENGIAGFYTEENPDGDGFPGWHIECSAMAKKFLGNKLDIHIGGIEHIPTHHTNEIAQSEQANENGKPYVKYWLHYEHLLIDGGKMSKSIGNVYTLADLEAKGFSGLDLRYFFLNAHYRSQQNFTWEALEAARKKRQELVNKYHGYKDSEQSDENSEDYENKFRDAISDDFNTSIALSQLWILIKDESIKPYVKYKFLKSWDQVLGLDLENSPVIKSTSLTLDAIVIDEDLKPIYPQLQELIGKRETARSEKNYALADELKKQISDLGIEVIDTTTGPQFRRK